MENEECGNNTKELLPARRFVSERHISVCTESAE